MLREYELTVILSAQGSQEVTKETVEKIETAIFAKGGALVKKDDWGLKRLSFPINKQFRGRYLHYDLTCDPDALKECERLMRLDEQVLRYLTVRIGEDVDVEKRKADLAKQAARAQAHAEASM